jgi:hypothetical protein
MVTIYQNKKVTTIIQYVAIEVLVVDEDVVDDEVE